MTKKITIFFLIMFVFLIVSSSVKGEVDLKEFMKKVTWSGQASILIQDDLNVYFDPFQIKDSVKADLIFITHGHQDHFSPRAIKKILKKETVIIAPLSMEKEIKAFYHGPLSLMSPGDTIEVKGTSIVSVPAYNLKKRFHPKTSGWLGYVLTINGLSLYHAGDTDRVPEMKNVSCDIVFLPLGQTYTMDSLDDAVLAALDVKASLAVPMHYGLYEGTEEDALEFKEKLRDKVDVYIMERK